MYDYWGNGYASEALKAVSNYLLNSGYYLVECSCNELNVQSSKVMLKAGFRKDGDNVEYKKVDIDFNKFRRNIINGIENYFDEWVNWNMCNNNKILKNRKIELEEKINKAKELLKDMI